MLFCQGGKLPAIQRDVSRWWRLVMIIRKASVILTGRATESPFKVVEVIGCNLITNWK